MLSRDAKQINVIERDWFRQQD